MSALVQKPSFKLKSSGRLETAADIEYRAMRKGFFSRFRANREPVTLSDASDSFRMLSEVPYPSRDCGTGLRPLRAFQR